MTASLPILHAGHPIWYRSQLAGVAANGEVYAAGWIEPRERPVLRALALAAFEAPHFSPDQQLSFAAYYLLPGDRWADLRGMPDDLIAQTTNLPVEIVQRRRTLPSLGLVDVAVEPESACA